MSRLCQIGVVEAKGFGRHQITAFGDYVLNLENSESLSRNERREKENDYERRNQNDGRILDFQPI